MNSFDAKSATWQEVLSLFKQGKSNSGLNTPSSVLSLDIETLTKDPTPFGKHHSIFSIAYGGYEYENGEAKLFETERFLKPEQSVQASVSKAVSSNEFQKRQFEAGAFSSWFDAESKNTLEEPVNAIKTLFDKIGKSSVLVIQNSRFESEHFSKVLEGSSELDQIKSGQRYIAESATNQASFLYAPPKITELRSKARIEYQQALSTSGPLQNEIFNRSVAAYDQMMAEYKQSFYDAMQGKGSIVAEQMDFTRALFAKAAQRNLIPIEHAQTGLSINFLTTTLLGRKEQHTALSDVRDQISLLLNKEGEASQVLKMYDELSGTGPISSETQKAFELIRRLQPEDIKRQFVSGLVSAFEELQEHPQGIRHIFNDSESLKRTNLTILDTSTGLPESIQIIDRSSSRINTTEQIFDSVMSRYNRFSEIKELRPYEIRKKLLEMDRDKAGISEKLEYLSSLRVSQESLFERTATNARNIADESNAKWNAINHNFDVIANKLSKLTPTQKGLSAAVIGGAVFAGMSAVGNDQSDKPEEEEQIRQYKSSLNSVMDMYAKPNVYYGTALANWNSAIGHHEY